MHIFPVCILLELEQMQMWKKNNNYSVRTDINSLIMALLHMEDNNNVIYCKNKFTVIQIILKSTIVFPLKKKLHPVIWILFY